MSERSNAECADASNGTHVFPLSRFMRKAETLLITPSIPAVHPLPLVQRDHVAAISQSGSNVADSDRLPSVDDETRSIANLLRSDLQKAD